jgi:DNA mismatch repair ATPase MutS
MISIFANGVFLRDIWLCARIDKWVKMNGQLVEDWFSIIHEYDKYISMAVFAFNRKEELTYPKLNEQGLLNSTLLAHPLIDVKNVVANDYDIDRKHFNIITGANMAGKSTFLRTVGLSIVMSNSGLPVCATSFDYNPIKLISSMRTNDSLSENESYFFSELKRLKYIVNEIEKEDYFIILDEILKGTNSKDKADGSAKFLRKVNATSSSGIIATHDLSLCVVANEIETVHNKYFDAQIIDGELYFDYKLKPGICKNMNASFLMKKMGIVDK